MKSWKDGFDVMIKGILLLLFSNIVKIRVGLPEYGRSWEGCD